MKLFAALMLMVINQPIVAANVPMTACEQQLLHPIFAKTSSTPEYWSRNTTYSDEYKFVWRGPRGHAHAIVVPARTESPLDSVIATVPAKHGVNLYRYNYLLQAPLNDGPAWERSLDFTSFAPLASEYKAREYGPSEHHARTGRLMWDPFSEDGEVKIPFNVEGRTITQTGKSMSDTLFVEPFDHAIFLPVKFDARGEILSDIDFGRAKTFFATDIAEASQQFIVGITDQRRLLAWNHNPNHFSTSRGNFLWKSEALPGDIKDVKVLVNASGNLDFEVHLRSSAEYTVTVRSKDGSFI